VAYIDDDSEAPRGWLACAEEIIVRFAPAAFGGPVVGIPGPTRPWWFKDAYLSQDHSSVPEARFLQPSDYGRIVGGNMFLRCDLVSKIGEFNPQLGMSGDSVAYGEESAFLNALAKHPEEKAYFDPALYNHDIKRPEKMEWQYALRSSFGAGRSSYRMRAGVQPADRQARVLIRTAQKALEILTNFALALIRRDRKRYPYIQNYIFECSTEYVRQLGRLYEHCCHFRHSHRQPRSSPNMIRQWEDRTRKET
jgi:hypothetical protein